MREHTTAAAPPRDAMHLRGFIQSLRPRQRQYLRYCEAERFRGLRLTTSSNFTVCWTGKSPLFAFENRSGKAAGKAKRATHQD